MGLARRFLFNDASWHGHCATQEDFRRCIRYCLNVHSALKRLGGGLEAGYSFRQSLVGFVPSVNDAIRTLSQEQRISLLRWLDKEGPFWDRPQVHDGANECFECNGELVTATALAEAAHLMVSGEFPVVVSLPDSRYVDSTLNVTWIEGPSGNMCIKVENATSMERVMELATKLEADFESYKDLLRWVQKECRYLAIVKKDILDQLGTQFISAAAKRGKELFAALDAIARALVANETVEFNALCQKWLRSERFSDASTTEKNDRIFRKAMTFPHACTGNQIECFWHGKIKTGELRIHFEWPPPFMGRRLFIGYFGPKLTKR